MSSMPVRVASNICIRADSVGGVAGEWVEGVNSTGLTLLYLHGGGHIAMSPRTQRPITAAFASAGLRVFAPAYRLAPEHRFPSALDDAVQCYRALLPSCTANVPLLLAGDSAGGGLALSTLVALREAGISLPGACVLFSPWADLTCSGESMSLNNKRCALLPGQRMPIWVSEFLSDRDPRDPKASPLHADLSGLPPLLIHAGRDEVLLDDSVSLAERARLKGVDVTLKIWPVVHHGWQLMPFIPEASESLREASQFLISHAQQFIADQ